MWALPWPWMPHTPTRMTSLAPRTRPADLVPAIVIAAAASSECFRKLRRVGCVMTLVLVERISVQSSFASSVAAEVVVDLAGPLWGHQVGGRLPAGQFKHDAERRSAGSGPAGVRALAPVVADCDHVEPVDRLGRPVVADMAEQADVESAIGLGVVRVRRQEGGAVETKPDRRRGDLLDGQRQFLGANVLTAP